MPIRESDGKGGGFFCCGGGGVGCVFFFGGGGEKRKKRGFGWRTEEGGPTCVAPPEEKEGVLSEGKTGGVLLSDHSLFRKEEKI